MNQHMRSGTCYLQVRRNATYPMDLSAVKVTQGKPESVMSGCIVIKMHLRIADTAFEPLSAEIDIEVPEDFVRRTVETEVLPFERPENPDGE